MTQETKMKSEVNFWDTSLFMVGKKIYIYPVGRFKYYITKLKYFLRLKRPLVITDIDYKNGVLTMDRVIK